MMSTWQVYVFAATFQLRLPASFYETIGNSLENIFYCSQLGPALTIHIELELTPKSE